MKWFKHKCTRRRARSTDLEAEKVLLFRWQMADNEAENEVYNKFLRRDTEKPDKKNFVGSS